MIADLRRLSKALLFAAEAHRNQRRKGAAQEPYLNHLIEVLDLVVDATGDTDMDMVIAALLHDVVEDTPTTYEDIAASFGERVAEIVRENSDNMSLPKAERRRARIDAMALKSREARIVKMADVISNLRAIAVSPAGRLVRGAQTWLSRGLPAIGRCGPGYGSFNRANLR